jgi:hypothetical protein
MAAALLLADLAHIPATYATCERSSGQSDNASRPLPRFTVSVFAPSDETDAPLRAHLTIQVVRRARLFPSKHSPISRSDAGRVAPWICGRFAAKLGKVLLRSQRLHGPKPP